MIKILKNWNEIRDSVHELRRDGLPHHGIPEKDWDLRQVRNLLDPLPRNEAVVDLGCGGSYCLRFLEAMQFSRLYGIDLTINAMDRLIQLKKIITRGRRPYRLFKGDLLKSPFPDNSFQAAVCLSVVEHGIDIDSLFREIARILRPSGVLYVSTDYWPDGNQDPPQQFGLPWGIFTRAQVQDIIARAATQGLTLLEPNSKIPETEDRTVAWMGCSYTFIAMMFQLTIPR